MLLPLVRRLERSFPKAALTWIISRPAYDLVAGMENIEFIVIDKPKSLGDYWRFKKQLRHRSFDVLLALQTTFRANLLYPLIKAQRKIGFNMPRRSDGHGFFVKEKVSLQREHTVDGFLKFSDHLKLKTKIIAWDLPINEADYEWAKQRLPRKGPILVVNPAASKPERSWLVERYIEVLQEAIKKWQLEIVLTGGPDPHDRVLADAILKAVPAIDLVGQTRPKQLLAVISKAHAVLCPDTGPSHMATAVNTPVIALHAVTNPLISGPYRFQHLVVNQYPEAQQRILGKSFEEHVWGAHVHDPRAMELISSEAVLNKLALVFS